MATKPLAATPSEVSVIIPYYNAPERLTLLLRALGQQQGGVTLEVVIADDGSPESPAIPRGLPFACTVVRQEDRGFRAAAARNLGAGAATGGLLLFLDGDTVPAAGYVAAMTRMLHRLDDAHGALVVGRRRHAELSAAGDAAALAFLRDDPPAPGVTDAGGPGTPMHLLGDPTWLLDGYRRTENLRAATDEDFRLVISAVLGVDRRLWAATGGFDEDFVGYGGEDWDFAWRAWLSGADFRYQPAAVAWHDGPDAAGREVDPTAKNAECLRLAQTIALPSVRGSGLVLEQPEIVVRYLGPTTGTAADAAVVACVAGLLNGSDAAVWFPGGAAVPADPCPLPPLLRGDPRVHAGDVPSSILDRARYQVWVDHPLRLTAPLHRYCALGEWDIPGRLRIRRTRALRREDPPPAGIPSDSGVAVEGVQPIPADISLERWWAGW